MQELGEVLQFQQMLLRRGSRYDFVFQNPGKAVWNEDGVQACTQRRIDV